MIDLNESNIISRLNSSSKGNQLKWEINNYWYKADKNGKYDYCPIFDNGASLLLDINMDYPLNEDTIDLTNKLNQKQLD